MRSVVLASLALVLSALAGCAGSAPQSSTTTPLLASADAGGDADAGSVSGTVVDDERSPIPNAQVSLVELKLEVRTGGNGSFEFLKVPEGSYTLASAALGYEADGRKVQVTADNLHVRVQIILLALPAVSEAFNSTIPFKGLMTCGFVAVPWCGILDEFQQTYGTPNPTNERWLFNFTYPGGVAPDAIIYEMDWKPSLPNTAQKFVLAVLIGSGIDQSVTMGSPLKLVASDGVLKLVKDGLKANKKAKFQFGIYPDLVDPVVNQSFNVYVTSFWGEEPADNWTIYNKA